MNKVINLTHFLAESTPAYGGVLGSVVIKPTRAIKKGDTSNNVYLQFPNHINTHIDFPRHFNVNGKTLNDYQASFWIFQSVAFIQGPVELLPVLVEDLPADVDLLIFKTGFGKHRGTEAYWAEQPVIPSTYASTLRNRFPKLRVFGFDMISLTSQLDKTEGKKAHLAFLCEEDILVLEDMNLDCLNEAPAQVIIAPLYLNDADGSPCTVFAIEKR